MPSFEFCMECHSELDAELPPDGGAARFFEDGRGLWQHVTRLDDEIVFSHEGHVANPGASLECGACHVGIESATTIDASFAIRMEACTECHAATTGPSDCAACHQILRRHVQPDSHSGNFLGTHGRDRRLRSLDPLARECAFCHTDRGFCDRCHQDTFPRDHTHYWRARGHAFMSSFDRDSCRVCHATADFCLRCHEETRPLDHRGSFGAPRNTHCRSCHLPLRRTRCRTCHVDAESHEFAPSRPGNMAHRTTDSGRCRACHLPMPHLDSGDRCTECHR